MGTREKSGFMAEAESSHVFDIEIQRERTIPIWVNSTSRCNTVVVLEGLKGIGVFQILILSDNIQKYVLVLHEDVSLCLKLPGLQLTNFDYLRFTYPNLKSYALGNGHIDSFNPAGKRSWSVEISHLKTRINRKKIVEIVSFYLYIRLSP